MHKTILHLLTLITFTAIPLAILNAKMIDGIALIVEGEAITTAEIGAVRTQFGVSKLEATNLLIQDRLQKAAMKDIDVQEEAIDKRIASIAAQNAMTIPKMQKVLKQQGSTWVTYRKSIRESLKKEKFYQEKVASSIPTPSEDELRLFYKNNEKSFAIPAKISMTEYSASSKENMEKFLRTHKNTYVKSRKVTKSIKDLESSLLTILLQTPNDTYTPAIKAGDKYKAYKVHAKEGEAIMPFKAAQAVVASKWKLKQRGNAVKDFFEKMKTRADIQKIR